MAAHPAIQNGRKPLFSEVMLILDGAGWVVNGDVRYPVGKGHRVAVPEGKAYFLRTNRRRRWRCFRSAFAKPDCRTAMMRMQEGPHAVEDERGVAKQPGSEGAGLRREAGNLVS